MHYEFVYLHICTYVRLSVCLSPTVVQPPSDTALPESHFVSADVTEAPPTDPTHDPVERLLHCRKTVELEEDEALAQLMSELPPEDPLPPLYGIQPPGPEALIYVQPGPLVSYVGLHACVVCVCTCMHVVIA